MRAAVMSSDGGARIANVQQVAETGVSVEVHACEEPPRGADVLRRADYREQKQTIFDAFAPFETQVAKEGATCHSEWLPVRDCGWLSKSIAIEIRQQVLASHIPFAYRRAWNLSPADVGYITDVQTAPIRDLQATGSLYIVKVQWDQRGELSHRAGMLFGDYSTRRRDLEWRASAPTTKPAFNCLEQHACLAAALAVTIDVRASHAQLWDGHAYQNHASVMSVAEHAMVVTLTDMEDDVVKQGRALDIALQKRCTWTSSQRPRTGRAPDPDPDDDHRPRQTHRRSCV